MQMFLNKRDVVVQIRLNSLFTFGHVVAVVVVVVQFTLSNILDLLFKFLFEMRLILLLGTSNTDLCLRYLGMTPYDYFM